MCLRPIVRHALDLHLGAREAGILPQTCSLTPYAIVFPARRKAALANEMNQWYVDRVSQYARGLNLGSCREPHIAMLRSKVWSAMACDLYRPRYRGRRRVLPGCKGVVGYLHRTIPGRHSGVANPRAAAFSDPQSAVACEHQDGRRDVVGRPSWPR